MAKDEGTGGAEDVGHVELASGPRGVIMGVRLSNGECPSRTFLAKLDIKSQTQFQARFEQLTAVGYLRNPDQYRPLQVQGDPRVCEIKTQSGCRLYVIQVGQKWIATHGRRKPKDRKVPAEVDKARKIFKEWAS